MTVNYELQIVNYDEKRKNNGDFVRIINWPVRDFEGRLNEAFAHRDISSSFNYCIYAIDENRNYTLVGEGDYDKDEGGGFYFVHNPKEDN